MEKTANITPDITDPNMKKKSEGILRADPPSERPSKIIEEDGEKYVRLPLEHFTVLKNTYDACVASTVDAADEGEPAPVVVDDDPTVLDYLKANKIKLIIIAVLVVIIIIIFYFRYKEYKKKGKNKHVRFSQHTRPEPIIPNAPPQSASAQKSTGAPTGPQTKPSGGAEASSPGASKQGPDGANTVDGENSTPIENNQSIVDRKLKEMESAVDDAAQEDSPHHEEGPEQPLGDQKEVPSAPKRMLEEPFEEYVDPDINTEGLHYSSEEEKTKAFNLLDGEFTKNQHNPYAADTEQEVGKIEELIDSELSDGAQSVASGGAPTCQGETKSGARCKKKATHGSTRCGLHN